jgi:hypothetical protein
MDAPCAGGAGECLCAEGAESDAREEDLRRQMM